MDGYKVQCGNWNSHGSLGTTGFVFPIKFESIGYDVSGSLDFDTLQGGAYLQFFTQFVDHIALRIYTPQATFIPSDRITCCVKGY